jgi:endonuclease/exonuclease/phosphatase family metal-dependent hydrolase
LNLTPTSGHILIVGDLNYTSDLEAMSSLLSNKDAFGADLGVNLTPNIDSRTEWYPADKPTREANFVLGSSGAAHRIISIKIENKNVHSDHAYFEVIYNILPGID